MAVTPRRKRRKISPPDDSSTSTLEGSSVQEVKPLAVDGYMANAARWNLEQDYESRPRKVKNKEKENTRLPIKTLEGRIEQLAVLDAQEEDAGSFLASESEDDEDVSELFQDEEPKKSSKEQIQEAKGELARLASLINEDPEEHIGGLKTIAEFSKSHNATVKRLALATQSAVFKDVIPGYRIRSLDEASMTEKVSKEVRRLRGFEQTLVSCYQTYVKDLSSCAHRKRGDATLDQQQTATVAISCACLLLLAAPHFNFRGDLLKILVDNLSGRRIGGDYSKCRTTLEKLFDEDEDGKPSQEAVAMLCRMIRSRNYNVDESVLNIFLHLRLLTEFSSKASHNSVDKRDDEGGADKKIKQKKVFRTKKQRKAAKELKAVEKEFREADATVSHEERDHLQAETLKLVFGTYFRILKARSPTLMGAVLEGLAKYAHLINQEFFGDLLVALQEIASQAMAAMDSRTDADEVEESSKPARSTSSNPYRTALLCTTTAFALLSSQDAANLHLDLSYFTNLLYTLLLPLSTSPDLELSSKSLRLADLHDSSALPTKVNATTLSTLLLRALQATLSPRNIPPTRLASFVHRLMLFALQTPEKTSLATVTLLRDVIKMQGRKVRGLWNSEERRGDGRFDPLGGIEASKPFCGTVWEGELLRLHYADPVSGGIGDLEKLVKGLA